MSHHASAISLPPPRYIVDAPRHGIPEENFPNIPKVRLPINSQLAPWIPPHDELRKTFTGGYSGDSVCCIVHDDLVCVRKASTGRHQRLEGESLCTQKVQEECAEFGSLFPTIYLRNEDCRGIYVDMEFLPGRNLADALAAEELTTATAATEIVALLEKAAAVSTHPMGACKAQSFLKTFLERAQSRLESLFRSERPLANRSFGSFEELLRAEELEIDGVACKGIMHHLPLMVETFGRLLEPRYRAPVVLHGDMTLLNMVWAEERLRLVDHRGLEKFNALLFELSKLTYSMRLFVPLVRDAVTVQAQGERTFKLHITEPRWGVLRKSTLDLLQCTTHHQLQRFVASHPQLDTVLSFYEALHLIGIAAQKVSETGWEEKAMAALLMATRLLSEVARDLSATTTPQ